VLDSGADVEFTFHIERPEAPGIPANLCLWDSDWPFERAPWRDVDQLLDKIRGWLESTAAGWPGDADCDLERYLVPQDLLLIYDESELAAASGLYRTSGGGNEKVIRVGERRSASGLARGRPSRRDRGLLWIDELGAVSRPVRTWHDIRQLLGESAETVQRLIHSGVIRFLLLGYQRGGNSARLALRVTGGVGGIDVQSCECADTSLLTRQLRAGPLAGDLAASRVAIVGLGAIGSFAADMLLRSGVRHLTLIDPELMRPGNLVRHLAGDEAIGQPKVIAVFKRLQATGLPTKSIVTRAARLHELREAIGLVCDNDVVLDTTANARATSLLAVAAELAGPGVGHAVISACVQRAGNVLRVDRFPLRRGEAHLPTLESDEEESVRERGCGSPVSMTPPTAVVAAAELAVRFVIDHATRECALPASLADVRRPQPQPPFNVEGRIVSEHG